MSDEHHLGEDFTFVVVTDGPFDMGRFLYLQTRHTGAAYPEYAKCWVNLRKVFANYYRSKWSFYKCTLMAGFVN